jgi:hypothetical protein
MPRLESHPRYLDRLTLLAPLDRALRVWLVAGVFALLLPGALQFNHYIGWLPYWLVAAPAISLALLHRHRLAAASSALLLVRGRRRRKPSAQRLRGRRARAGSGMLRKPAAVR